MIWFDRVILAVRENGDAVEVSNYPTVLSDIDGFDLRRTQDHHWPHEVTINGAHDRPLRLISNLQTDELTGLTVTQVLKFRYERTHRYLLCIGDTCFHTLILSSSHSPTFPLGYRKFGKVPLSKRLTI